MNDPSPAPAIERSRPSRQAGLLTIGVERVGLLPLAFPALATVVMIVLSVAAVLGVARLTIDDSLSQLFRSDSAEFRQYEALLRRFPSSEFDVLAVVEGEVLLRRNALQKLRDAVTDVQLIDGTRGVISLFSARNLPQNGGTPAPLVPDVLPEGADYERLIAQVRGNQIIRDKLLSDDGQLALIVIALDQEAVRKEGLEQAVGAIRRSLDTTLAGSGLNARLSGVPVMQLEIREAVARDSLIYNIFGFIAGCAIAALFFRSLSFIVIATAPPLLAILWSLGLLGWLDFRLNMFLNVMTPLIMVISFSDSMQLAFAARDRLMAGDGKREAFRQAILVVGPACVLTHATAALSFIALQFSESDLIRTFGQAGLVATLVAVIAVLTLVPLLGILLHRDKAGLRRRVKGPDRGLDMLRGFCGWIAGRMVSRPALYSLINVLIVGALALAYVNLEPRYRLADQVPDRHESVAASARLDAKLTGANPLHVLIELPANASLYDAQTLQTIADAHAVIEAQAGVGNVWSLETLRRWLAKAGSTEVSVLKKYVDALPEYLTRRFISVRQDAVVITGRIPDEDASQLLPLIDKLENALGEVRARHPGYRISVTGLAAIAARNSADMIGKLNWALTVEVLVVAAFLGAAFRSLVVMIVSIMPAVFPVLLAGNVLLAMGEGLQFASVVALTVSFGLGLTATIHFLNRMSRESRVGQAPGVAVERATVLMGPPLILTTLVLACGLAVTVFSALPSLRLFGWLSAFAIVAALIADLLILRPTIIFVGNLAGRTGRWFGTRAR